MTVFDLDDFLYEHTHLADLDRLHDLTGCKVTLFTILRPANPEHYPCSTYHGWPTLEQTASYLHYLKQTRDWVEFAVHGYAHTPLECRDWDKNIANMILDMADDMGCFVKGFKAPYWETSHGLYDALRERGWWIADHDRNDIWRPRDLRVYKVGPESVHGHVQDIGSNGLREAWNTYAAMNGPFKFISEIMA